VVTRTNALGEPHRRTKDFHGDPQYMEERVTTTDGPYADTRDMYVAHTMFRREFGLMPALVRGVTAGDKERTQIVGEHMELLNMVLDHHHAAEDKHLWPRLLDRGSESVAPVVHLMEGQHENIGKTIARVSFPSGSSCFESAASASPPT